MYFCYFLASLQFALQCPIINCNLAFIIHSKNIFIFETTVCPNTNITLLILLDDNRLLNSNGPPSNECLFLMDLESGCGSLIPQGSMCVCFFSFYLHENGSSGPFTLGKHKKAGLPLLLSLERAQFFIIKWPLPRVFDFLPCGEHAVGFDDLLGLANLMKVMK